MRGALLVVLRIRHSRGIIPADAGSTLRSCSRSIHPWDHPRGCGEHDSKQAFNDYAEGSSPRMRGALGRHRPHRAQGRIIPADAGGTDLRERGHDGHEDHPRGCGEHQL